MLVFKNKTQEQCVNVYKDSLKMHIKNLQYVMGHSDMNVTLNVYTHVSFDRVAEQMAKTIDLSKQREKHIACKCV